MGGCRDCEGVMLNILLGLLILGLVAFLFAASYTIVKIGRDL